MWLQHLLDGKVHGGIWETRERIVNILEVEEKPWNLDNPKTNCNKISESTF